MCSEKISGRHSFILHIRTADKKALKMAGSIDFLVPARFLALQQGVFVPRDRHPAKGQSRAHNRIDKQIARSVANQIAIFIRER